MKTADFKCPKQLALDTKNRYEIPKRKDLKDMPKHPASKDKPSDIPSSTHKNIIPPSMETPCSEYILD
jgi:hypothetical protein